jgi:hypothetical protein
LCWRRRPMPENDNLHKDIGQWACERLVSLGYTLKSNLPEQVLNTPWSYIVRFETSKGYIYLKHTPDLLALEVNIIQILQDQFHAAVPTVIAHHAALNCFLMKDAGRPLREMLKRKFDTTLFCKAIDQFTSIQLAAADHVDVFLDLGVPDWRLDTLPDLYKQLLSQKDILMADGLSAIEISACASLTPKVSKLCQTLSEYAIKATIVQPDFNDNNMLIANKSQDITIIDLGEIVISHPFFSWINFLQQLKKHHALKDEDATYLRLRDACFKNHRMLESEGRLADAFAIANILFFVYAALCGYRLYNACDQERLMSFQQHRHGRFSSGLKKFMTACLEMDG